MSNRFTLKLFFGLSLFVAAMLGVGAWRHQDDLGAFALSLIAVASLGYLLFKDKDSPVFLDVWRPILQDKVQFYKELTVGEKMVFEHRIALFLSTIEVTGVDFEMDDECRVLVAASSVIPFWDLPQWEYGRLQEVLVYSGNFDENYRVGEDSRILGMVGSGGHMDRVMLLSKKALYYGFDNKTNKSHVGFHEFAHLLDKSDGEVDGIPELFLPKEKVNPWTKLVHKEMQKIRENESDIDPYGATSDSEFFAVISEYYFKRPHLLERKHADLFKMLQLIYHPQNLA
ncbi:M90 family metallopeptidase [Reichenbachiella ulvae]|uniref:Zinc-dependent peptidase n=1 Tax=Reichenbachiella ulvae TaxID=2980104 RepID=A0ABT3CR68_9BACT|nr:M90 family metallopeptidase [Reichenbachiella ulvae]MCV9386132.1 zinc-dependent peptidase [Reichenbachiella ulvae]